MKLILELHVKLGVGMYYTRYTSPPYTTKWKWTFGIMLGVVEITINRLR